MPGLLIFIGLILIILNVISIKKQNNSFNGVLGNAIENTHDYDIRLGEIRRECSESISELQSEIMYMKEIIEKSNRLNKNEEQQLSGAYSKDVNYKNDNEKIYVGSDNKIIIDEPITRTSTRNSNSNSEKIEEIKRLFSEGLSTTEVSEILHLGKGEVILIKDLYIR
ncbi:hypothetical protein [Clostridium sp.]|uniref:DUF6115 domain-containing protein n=1 Tax=Clostridium sp. TaxID=1506 RepID=UPI001A49B66C|nr:hypothetical protein [Clostridium sp.]MBK5236656.1 hypothetical protein [Clostridium sp.]